MARGIEVKVTANTKAARTALKDLDAEVQKMQKRAASRNKQAAGQDSSGGGLLGDISGMLFCRVANLFWKCTRCA